MIYGDYLPIVILMVLAAAIAIAFIIAGAVFGPRKPNLYKQSPYECGVQPIGDTRERFPIKFYLVGMLFILFDIEVVFLWSWLTVFKNAPLDFQIYSFTAVMIYMVLWLIGDAYILRLNAVDWEDSTAIADAHTGILSEKLLGETNPILEGTS